MSTTNINDILAGEGHARISQALDLVGYSQLVVNRLEKEDNAA